MKRLSKMADAFDRLAAPPYQAAIAPPSFNKPKPTHTISLRVTDAEKARLERDAAGMSRSAYIRERLFCKEAGKRTTRGKFPVKDYEALGRVLGLLGRSNLAADLNELDWAIEQSVIKIDAPTALAIKMACVDIASMRADLVIALGLKPERKP